MLDARAFDEIDTYAEHAHEFSAALPRFVLASVRAAPAFSENAIHLVSPSRVVIHLGKLDRL
jgi:hypothetical protein